MINMLSQQLQQISISSKTLSPAVLSLVSDETSDVNKSLAQQIRSNDTAIGRAIREAVQDKNSMFLYCTKNSAGQIVYQKDEPTTQIIEKFSQAADNCYVSLQNQDMLFFKPGTQLTCFKRVSSTSFFDFDYLRTISAQCTNVKLLGSTFNFDSDVTSIQNVEIINSTNITLKGKNIKDIKIVNCKDITIYAGCTNIVVQNHNIKTNIKISNLNVQNLSAQFSDPIQEINLDTFPTGQWPQVISQIYAPQFDGDNTIYAAFLDADVCSTVDIFYAGVHQIGTFTYVTPPEPSEEEFDP